MAKINRIDSYSGKIEISSFDFIKKGNSIFVKIPERHNDKRITENDVLAGLTFNGSDRLENPTNGYVWFFDGDEEKARKILSNTIRKNIISAEKYITMLKNSITSAHEFLEKQCLP